MTFSRDDIISEIKKLYEQDGSPPGQRSFAKATGIAESQWRGRFWARWSDALRAAGLEANEPSARLNSDEVLKRIADASAKLGRLPTYSEYRLLKAEDPTFPAYQTLLDHLGGAAEQAAAVLSYCERYDLHANLRATLRPHDGSVATLTHSAIEGCVYLLKSGAAYKIGRSDNIERRIKEIAISMPEKVTLVHSIRTDDPIGIEAYWHNRFGGRRLNGEWFKLEPADIAAFRRRKYQ